MKYLLLFLSIIIFSVSFSQTKNYTISELKGMEDQQEHTHLFYRLYYSEGDQGNYSYGNSVYHFDLVNNIDTLFFNDYGSYTIRTNYYQGVKDYEFWDNDPSKFIYLGISCGMDCSGYVQRFDNSVINSWIFFFPGNKIEISNQNDSLLYSSSQFLVKSTDGGRHWFVVDSAYQGYRLVSMSPFDDKVLFVLDNNSNLSKTIDGCKYFTVADTTKLSLSPTTPMFNYDKDKMRIYRISSFFNGDRGIPAFYVSPRLFET